MLLTIKTKFYREGDSWIGQATINTDKGPLKLIARQPMAPERNRVAGVVGKLYLTDAQPIPVADPDFEIVGAVGCLRDEGLIDDPQALAVVLGCIGSVRADEALNYAEANDLPRELNYGFENNFEDGDYSGRGLEIVGGCRLGRVGIIGNPAEVGYWGDPLTPQVAALNDTRINDLAACAHSDIAALRAAALQRRGVHSEVGFNPFKTIAKGFSAGARDLGKAASQTVETFTKAPDIISKGFEAGTKDIAKAGEQFVKTVKLGPKALQQSLGAITNNPLWDIAATGVSFIPGIGSAVSAGMATAAAVGRGLSLEDAALMGAKAALPGGPLAAAALDAAVGVAQGKSLDQVALNVVKKQVPGGQLGQAVFDAGTAVAQGKKIDTAALAKAGLSQVKIAELDKALKASKALKGTLPAAQYVRDLTKKAKPVLRATVVQKPKKPVLTPMQRATKIAALAAVAKKEYATTKQVSKKTYYEFKELAGEKAASKLLADLKGTKKPPAKKGGIDDAARRAADAAKKQAAAAVAKAQETAAKAGKKLDGSDLVKEAKILDMAASKLTRSKVTAKLAVYVQEAVKAKTAEKIAESFASVPAAASYTTALSTLEAAERGTRALKTAKADALKKQGKKTGEILKTLLGKTEGGASSAALATLAELGAQSKKGDKKAAMWLSMMNRAKKDREKLRATKAKLQKKLKALGSTAVVVMPDGRMMRGALSAIKGAKPADKKSKGLPIVIDNGKLFQLPKNTKFDGFKRV